MMLINVRIVMSSEIMMYPPYVPPFRRKLLLQTEKLLITRTTETFRTDVLKIFSFIFRCNYS